MGVARGRFVVEGHAHAQRFAAKWGKQEKKPDYATLAEEMLVGETYDNSERLLYDMERYGVDMCVISSMWAMNNKINGELVQKYPKKFIAKACAVETNKKALRGQKEWTVDAAAKELDDLFSTGLYKGGIGEGLPFNMARKTTITKDERLSEIKVFFDVAKQHKVPVGWHSGTATGYAGSFTVRRNMGAPDWIDVTIVHDIASLYPDVTIIMEHGGMQGWWGERFMEPTLHLAATYDNVYLECGMWWSELYEKALIDPCIGPEKLLWGTDWGASMPIYYQLGHYPPSYVSQIRRRGIVAHQVDYFGWSLRQLDKLDLDQDDLNLILGGNAVKIYKIEMPLSRLFKEYIPRERMKPSDQK